MARIFRLWEKKRGDRRTGSPLVGVLGEVMFFGALFMLGAFSLAYLFASKFVAATPTWYEVGFGFWLMVLVMISLTLIGGGGAIFTVLQIGTSAERRSAMAQKAADIDLIGDKAVPLHEFPTVPRDANLTNSPGVRLAYRLPISDAGAWVLIAATVFFLVCNGILAVVLILATRSHVAGRPDWFLTLFLLPFLAIGIWATYYFAQKVMLHTGIGPTNVEISDHPFHLGGTYRLFLSQAGRLRLRRLDLSLVCEEEATYRQGTDIRTERCRVYQQLVFSRHDIAVAPSQAFEIECELSVPENVMHSFRAKHNAVHWMLVVWGDARNWPPFERSFPVIVSPVDVTRGAP